VPTKLLLLVAIVVALIASMTNVFEPRPVYTSWYLATAQKMTDEGRRVHARTDVAEGELTFETPMMTREMALSVAHAEHFAERAEDIGYRKFEFTNGKATWFYNLQTDTISP